MKRLTHIVLGLSTAALLSLGTTFLLAQGSNRGEAKATVGAAHVSIDYGRPSLKGREPLKMITPGQVWRLGANAPTTIDTDQDLFFGSTRVPKGKHILLAQMVEPGKWVLLVSTKAANEYDPSARIAEVPMKVDNSEEAVEQLTIKLSGHKNRGDIEIAWGSSRLAASFSVAE